MSRVKVNLCHMKLLLFLFVIISPITLLLPCEPFQAKSIPPKDESAKDPSFVTFKTQLQKAVKAKDDAFLLNTIDPQVHFSFGDDPGKKNFKKYFSLEQKPKDSNVWKILEDTLKLGFFLNPEGNFVSPYLFENFPQDLDPTSYSVVSGTNVNVREAPSTNAKVLEKLSHSVVAMEYGEEIPKTGECNWQKVCLANGTTGYICDKYLRSPLDYRIFFEKKKHKWMITTFIVGD